MYPRIPRRRSTNGRRARVRSLALAAVATCALALPGCSLASGHAGGELGADQQLLDSCPGQLRLASKIDIDVSGSGRTSDLSEERMNAVRDVARETAVCGGHLRVTAFSATSAATVVLYDGELNLPGATDNARLRRVPDVVDDTTAKVAAAYQANLSSLSPGGSDIAGQYRLAGEYLAQLGGGHQLRLTLLTDGFQTAGFQLGDTALDPNAAQALAAQAGVPKLSGAVITVAGLGQVTGSPPSSAVVAGLVAFYDALCHEADAAECLSVTDYTTAGR